MDQPVLHVVNNETSRQVLVTPISSTPPSSYCSSLTRPQLPEQLKEDIINHIRYWLCARNMHGYVLDFVV